MFHLNFIQRITYLPKQIHLFIFITTSFYRERMREIRIHSEIALILLSTRSYFLMSGLASKITSSCFFLPSNLRLLLQSFLTTKRSIQFLQIC